MGTSPEPINGNEADSAEPAIEDSDDTAEVTTTLVEVVPGAVVVFGDIPDGLVPLDMGLIPGVDLERLSVALGSLGNTGTVGGNLANAVASTRGLYRVDAATQALLNAGGKLAVKDGAKLGGVFMNTKLVAQARFIPAGVTAAQTVAAIGPALGLIALQMMLSEVSALVETNIALTKQTLKTIRHEQWSELTGLVKSIDLAIKQANEIGGVTRSLWNNVAGHEAILGKQYDLYKRKVTDHNKQLGRLSGTARRQHLETNAEAILFDAFALLYSLKARTGYQAIRAAWARSEGVHSEKEAQLVEVITRDARAEYEAARQHSTELLESLHRELNIIAKLPGRATLPLSRSRRAAKTSQLSCQQLVQAIEPLADALRPASAELTVPSVLCAPDHLDLKPYLNVLRWFLDEGEELHGLAFPYLPGPHNLAGVVPAVLGRRIDATWSSLGPGRFNAVADKAASSTLIAVTNRRVITAAPRALTQRGKLGQSYPLSEVRHVRRPDNENSRVRPTVDVITEKQDLRWMFPSTADVESIDALAALLRPAVVDVRGESAAVGELPV